MVCSRRHMMTAMLFLLSLGTHVETFRMMSSLRSPPVPRACRWGPIKPSQNIRSRQVPRMQLQGGVEAVAEAIVDGAKTTQTLVKLGRRSTAQTFDRVGSLVPDPSETDARIALLVVAALSGTLISSQLFSRIMWHIH